MSEPLTETAGTESPSADVDVGTEAPDRDQEATDHSSQFLDRALERAGAERDTDKPEWKSDPKTPWKAERQPQAREKSPAQIRHEAKMVERNERRVRDAEQAAMARILAALDAPEPEPQAAAVEDDDPEPDPEIDWREWNAWRDRKIIKAMEEKFAPINTFFQTLQERQDQAFQEQQQMERQIEQVQAVKGFLDEGTREYETFAPGYMERINASAELYWNRLVRAGFDPEMARRSAAGRILEWFDAAGRVGLNPHEAVDRMATAEIEAAGYVAPQAAPRVAPEIAQRRAAASTPMAGSVGQGGRVQAPSGAANGSGVLSTAKIKELAIKKYGTNWRAHIQEIVAGQTAAVAKSEQRR